MHVCICLFSGIGLSFELAAGGCECGVKLLLGLGWWGNGLEA